MHGWSNRFPSRGNRVIARLAEVRPQPQRSPPLLQDHANSRQINIPTNLAEP
jgi:hypothetical protein